MIYRNLKRGDLAAPLLRCRKFGDSPPLIELRPKVRQPVEAHHTSICDVMLSSITGQWTDYLNGRIPVGGGRVYSENHDFYVVECSTALSVRDL